MNGFGVLGLRGLVLAGACVVVLGAAGTARAAQTIEVTTTGDGVSLCPSPSSCSLRGAVTLANSESGDTVHVPASATPYTINAGTGQIAVNANMTIAGDGATNTVVDGGGATRIFEIGTGSATPTVTISGLTLQDANAGGGGSPDFPGFGGAVYVKNSSTALTVTATTFTSNTGSLAAGALGGNGPLTVQRSSFSLNTSPAGGAIHTNSTINVTGSTFSANTASPDGVGGAIQTNGTINVTGSTFSGNTAAGNGLGGAIFTNAVMTIQSSTFTGNTAATGAGNNGAGGAIHSNATVTISTSTLDHNTTGASGAGGAGGAIHGNAPVTLTNSTLAANSANGSGAPYGLGGALALNDNTTLTSVTLASNSASVQGGNAAVASTKTVTLKNTIVASGSAPAGGNCAGPGTYSSSGHNLEDTGPSQCGLVAAMGDLIGPNPLLGPLQGNGGPTQTRALSPGSPAIDAGGSPGCPGTDQRGVVRPQGTGCDIGAYEVAPPSATTVGASGIGPDFASLNALGTNPDVQAGSLFFQYGTTTAYGSQTVSEPLTPQSGPSGFSATVTKLSPGRTYHFRAVAQNPDGMRFGPDQTFTTASAPRPAVPPSLSGLSISPKRFQPPSGGGASIAAKRKRKQRGGATVSYRDSQAAKTTFTVLRPARGFRVGGRCTARRPKPRAKRRVRRCTRYVPVGSFVHADRTGLNRFRFTGRVNGKRLRRGRYRLQAIARNSAGKISRPASTAFQIIR